MALTNKYGAVNLGQVSRVVPTCLCQYILDNLLLCLQSRPSNRSSTISGLVLALEECG